MPQTRCLNCEAVLPAQAHFCPACSQRADTTRLTMSDMLRESMHSFLNVDRGPVAMLRGLLTRPGGMARDQVHGRRRRHCGPFATLVVLAGATALLVNAAGYDMLAHDAFGAASTDFLQRHFNLLLLVQLPLLGAACAVVFRSASLTLPEPPVLRRPQCRDLLQGLRCGAARTHGVGGARPAGHGGLRRGDRALGLELHLTGGLAPHSTPDGNTA